MKAKFVRQLDNPVSNQRLYRLENGQHIVVSAINAMFSGPETYIFRANEDGDIIDWCEMDGSFRGALDHARALNNGGYELEEP